MIFAGFSFSIQNFDNFTQSCSTPNSDADAASLARTRGERRAAPRRAGLCARRPRTCRARLGTQGPPAGLFCAPLSLPVSTPRLPPAAATAAAAAARPAPGGGAEAHAAPRTRAVVRACARMHARPGLASFVREHSCVLGGDGRATPPFLLGSRSSRQRRAWRRRCGAPSPKSAVGTLDPSVDVLARLHTFPGTFLRSFLACPRPGCRPALRTSRRAALVRGAEGLRADSRARRQRRARR